MRVTALDHIVLNVADQQRSLDFYAGKLDLPAERVDLWREGKVGFPSVRVNEHTILDLAKRERSGENLAHFCLVVEGDIDAVRAELEGKGVAIHSDTRPRSGARGSGSSFYLDDPDGNEIEIRGY
jgi:catechol 2,3-dioxygenase-like lactoylglutathione lyase family enzyme